MSENKEEYLIGANYYCGWYRCQPNRWQTDGRDWRLDYPGRIPMLGCFNDQATFEAEIEAAADYGLNFFALLWYSDEQKEFPFTNETNKCFQMFLKAGNKDRLRFLTEYCNHPPFQIFDDDVWRRKADLFVQWMKDPSYLRVDGKCVFKFHSVYYLLQETGMDRERARERVRYLREAARREGLELLVSAGIVLAGVDEDSRSILDCFDFLSTYGDIPEVPSRENPYPYEVLEAHAAAGRREIAAKGEFPYMPFIQSGWDPRPWKDPRPSFCLPDRMQWRRTLTEMKRALDECGNLGIPTSRGVQKAFNIYAWNEFGEGGMLAPTLGDGFMKLEEIRTVFGK